MKLPGTRRTSLVRWAGHSREDVHGQRFFILLVLTIDGTIAHDIIPGSVTSDLSA